jgi:hypothetical protein
MNGSGPGPNVTRSPGTARPRGGAPRRSAAGRRTGHQAPGRAPVRGGPNGVTEHRRRAARRTAAALDTSLARERIGGVASGEGDKRRKAGERGADCSIALAGSSPRTRRPEAVRRGGPTRRSAPGRWREWVPGPWGRASTSGRSTGHACRQVRPARGGGPAARFRARPLWGRTSRSRRTRPGRARVRKRLRPAARQAPALRCEPQSSRPGTSSDSGTPHTSLRLARHRKDLTPSNGHWYSTHESNREGQGKGSDDPLQQKNRLPADPRTPPSRWASLAAGTKRLARSILGAKYVCRSLLPQPPSAVYSAPREDLHTEKTHRAGIIHRVLRYGWEYERGRGFKDRSRRRRATIRSQGASRWRIAINQRPVTASIVAGC